MFMTYVPIIFLFFKKRMICIIDIWVGNFLKLKCPTKWLLSTFSCNQMSILIEFWIICWKNALQWLLPHPYNKLYFWLTAFYFFFKYYFLKFFLWLIYFFQKKIIFYEENHCKTTHFFIKYNNFFESENFFTTLACKVDLVASFSGRLMNVNYVQFSIFTFPLVRKKVNNLRCKHWRCQFHWSRWCSAMIVMQNLS